MKYLIISLFSMSVLLMSCNDDDNAVPPADDSYDYLIFGTYYGECIGNCAHFFKFEDGKLFADKVEIGIPANLEFEDAPLANTDYELAEELLDVPDDITLSDKSVWGCPDCADQGGVYLEIGYETDLVATYRIDTSNDELTPDIIAYKDRILAIVNELEN